MSKPVKKGSNRCEAVGRVDANSTVGDLEADVIGASRPAAIRSVPPSGVNLIGVDRAGWSRMSANFAASTRAVPRSRAKFDVTVCSRASR